MKYAKILVPTDFSDCAKEAARCAAGLARQDGASLHLVHAVLPTDYPMYQVIRHGNFPDYEEEVRKNCQGFLDDLAAEVAQGIETTREVVEGFPGQVIQEKAGEHGADLIVLGTHGHTGFKHVVLGSTAEAVVRHSTCPVLTVHETGGTAPEKIERVLAPTDFSDQGFQAVEYARKFAARTGAELILAHVMDAPIYPDGPFGMVAVQMPTLEQEIRDALTDRLTKETDRLTREGAEVRSVLREGRAHVELVASAEEEKADLIVMGTHGYRGVKHLLLGSTAEQVVRRAQCPVLTLHPYDE